MALDRALLFDMHKGLTHAALELMKVKNRDYGENDDPFRNFRRWGLLGILVRLGDKLARLETFVERGDLKVVDEQVRDTVLDIINYAVLFEGYHEDANRTGSTSRNSPGPGPARPVDQGLISRLAHSRAGSPRSDTGSTRRGEDASPIFPAFDPDIHVTGRASAGGGRRGTMGKQSRQRKGA